MLVDDLDDLTGLRINQHGVIVHISVSITLDVILARNVVISHSVWGQNRTNSQIAIVVRGVLLVCDIFMETRAIVDPKNPADRSGDRTDRPADHCSHRASVSVADCGTFLRGKGAFS